MSKKAPENKAPGISIKGNTIRKTGKGVGPATSLPLPVKGNANDVVFEDKAKEVLTAMETLLDSGLGGVTKDVIESTKKKTGLILEEIQECSDLIIEKQAHAIELTHSIAACDEAKDEYWQELKALNARLRVDLRADYKSSCADAEELKAAVAQGILEHPRGIHLRFLMETNAEILSAEKASLDRHKMALAKLHVRRVEAEKDLEVITGNPLIKAYEETTLGDGVSVGFAEIGSQEWHNLRYFNSDGKFVMTGSRAAGVYDCDPYKRTKDIIEGMLEGLKPERDRDFGFKTAQMALGDMMEEPILRMVAKKYHEDTFFLTKDTLEYKKDSRFRVNLDGLYCSDGSGVPHGIVEIKTASNAESWTNEAGEYVVPPNYMAQLKQGCAVTGFTDARIAVMINQYDFRTIDVKFTKKEIEDHKKATIAFLDNVESMREDYLKGLEVAA